MSAYRSTIPVHSGHVAIVLGRNFSTLNNIKTRFGVGIHFNKAEPEQNRPMPYFVVCGQEKQVHLCINEIQRLVIISMSNYINRFESDTGGNYGTSFIQQNNRERPRTPTTPEAPESPDYSPQKEIKMAPVPQTKKKRLKVKFVQN